VHSPEELRLLVMQARAHGTLDESDSAMLAGVFDFHNKRALDVMRPRTEMVAIAEDVELEELREIMRRERYSRYPVFRDTADDIVGVFLAKDFWLADDPESFALRDHLREPLFVPASRAAERVLDDLRRTRAHLAVVLDEYGGTAGIVTLEDVLEEIVGEIEDEFDDQEQLFAWLDDRSLRVDPKINLEDLQDVLGIELPLGEGSETLAGLIYEAAGRVPAQGDRVAVAGLDVEVERVEDRRIMQVRLVSTVPLPGRQPKETSS
jgi:CBS domain containing-hemolysin-like protein